MRNRVTLNEEQLYSLIRSTVKRCLCEAYGKWFQTEENGSQEVLQLMTSINDKLNNLSSLSPEELWETIRTLAYINHSAFKVRPGMWDVYPDEMLCDYDKSLNDMIYSYKAEALKKIVAFYIENGLDISTDEKGSMVILRDPITGRRQITFHVGKQTFLTEPIKNRNGAWDGVKQAHHYTNDDDYDRMRFNNANK